jgi:hypothetical protein
MGLFFGRKKQKKEQLHDLADLEPFDLTNAIVDEPVSKKLSRKEKRQIAKDEKNNRRQLKGAAADREETMPTLELSHTLDNEAQLAPERPIVPPIKIKNTGDSTRDAMAQKFADLRRVVAQQKSDEEFNAKTDGGGQAFDSIARMIPDTDQIAEFSEGAVDESFGFDLQQRDEIGERDGQAVVDPTIARAPPQSARVQLTDDWLGLWVSEDGRSIYIEEVEIGNYQVTALPDPMSKCYFGPDFPEIETWQMPAQFVREKIGDVMGERLKIDTVPGLPDGHYGPTVNLYFLAEADGGDAGETRFAEDADTIRSIFMVCDSDPGSVNPWGSADQIEWLGDAASFYKAPEKLEHYLANRMVKEEPHNAED